MARKSRANGGRRRPHGERRPGYTGQCDCCGGAVLRRRQTTCDECMGYIMAPGADCRGQVGCCPEERIDMLAARAAARLPLFTPETIPWKRSS